MAMELVFSSGVIISAGASMISPFAINVPALSGSDDESASDGLVAEKSISHPISNETSEGVSLFSSRRFARFSSAISTISGISNLCLISCYNQNHLTDY